MADYSNMLTSNEQVLRVAHRHILFMLLNTIFWFVGSVLLLALALLVFLQSPWQETIIAGIIVLGSLLPLAVTLYRFMVWRSERYILTTYRIIQLEGIVNKRFFDSALEKINDVEMRQTFFGRLFNYGSIHILTASDTAINDLDGIADPFDFKRMMVETKIELGSSDRTARTVSSEDERDSNGEGSYESNARLVVALTELRNSGMISEKEFDEKMRNLTGG